MPLPAISCPLGPRAVSVTTTMLADAFDWTHGLSKLLSSRSLFFKLSHRQPVMILFIRVHFLQARRGLMS